MNVTDALRQQERTQLLNIFKRFKGDKCLFFDKSLHIILNVVLNDDDINKERIQHVFLLDDETEVNVSKLDSVGNILFFLRPQFYEVENVFKVIERVAKCEGGTFGGSHLGGGTLGGDPPGEGHLGGGRKYALVFIPYMTPMCEGEILKHNSLDIHIRVIVFPLYFFPLYDDVFSLEMKGLYKEYYVDSDITNLLMCSFSLMFLQHLFNGVFKSIKSLGHLSHLIVEQLINLRKEIVASNFDIQAPNKFDEDLLDILTNLQNMQDVRQFGDSGQPPAIPVKYALHKIFLSERARRRRGGCEKKKKRKKKRSGGAAPGEEEEESGGEDGSSGEDGSGDDDYGDGDDDHNRDHLEEDHPDEDHPDESPPDAAEGDPPGGGASPPWERTKGRDEQSIKREAPSQGTLVETGGGPNEGGSTDSASDRSRHSRGGLKRGGTPNSGRDGSKSSSPVGVSGGKGEEGMTPSRGCSAVGGRRKGAPRGRASKEAPKPGEKKRTESEEEEAHPGEEYPESDSSGPGPNFMAKEDNTSFLMKKNEKQKMERKSKRERSSHLQEKLGIGDFNFLLNVSPKIDCCVIIDRRIDMVTPFCTPFTYEGLLDHLFGISNLQIEIPRYIIFNEASKASKASTPSTPLGERREEGSQHHSDVLKNMMVRVKLKNSVDVLYNDIKDLNPNQVGLYLHNKASEIKETYKEKDTLKDIEEINTFLKKIKVKHYEHNSLSTHVNLASFILTTMKKEANFNKLKLEDEIIQLNSTSDRTTLLNIVQQIKLLIYTNEDIYEVYRLLCLFSVVTNGFSETHINELKKDILESYGIRELSRINKLHLCNIIKHQPKQKFIWGNLRNHFNLLSNDHNDISYVCNGYAPLSVRLIEYMGILKNNMQAFPEIFNLLSGPTLDIVQNAVGYGKFGINKGERKKEQAPWGGDPEGQKDVVLLFYVGGISYAEIAAIRNLNRHSRDYHYLIFTTEVISSRRLLQGLAAP
ncbi:vacuolar protein sorting-associated protein 33, putative [Plasmodium vivax]|uniref:Vacuolar protein sorting-associated protein 33, putative n=1 Tax=Plasmodium vivax TaxID=5855 RepID=A0A1G4GVQ6_PLAVI|nr:vacuolar protein sorting-associated protein 33, putative [Plasmodium vivax]